MTFTLLLAVVRLSLPRCNLFGNVPNHALLSF